jgi:hypothetical protein
VFRLAYIERKWYPICTLAFTQLTRFTFTACVGLALATGLVACVDGSLDTPGDTGSFGVGASPGAGAAGGTTGTGAGSGAGAGTSVGGTSPNDSGAGGTSATGSGGDGAGAVGGVGSGGTAGGVGSGGTAGSGSGGAPPVCTDIPAPSDNPSWEGTCEQWKNEANACEEPWFKQQGYCNETCGRCTSSGSGGTGNTGSGGTGNTGSGGTGNTGPKYKDLTSGPEYHASRYWDCCKTHCATNAGAKSCGQDGMSPDGGQSSCNGGSAFACYSEAPRAISDDVSYGYVAVPNPSCNTCYHIQFTGEGYYTAADKGSQLIRGKHMIVKVSNTGSDVSHKQFDLMIPGGGVGIFTQGCQRQWGNIDFGAQYGGFYSGDSANPQCNAGTHEQKKACVKTKCNQLPAGRAREGCYWWVDWMQLADNPKFRFEPIQCPNDI